MADKKTKDPLRDAVEEATRQDIEAASRALDRAVHELHTAVGHVKAWQVAEPLPALKSLIEGIEMTAVQLERAAGILEGITQMPPWKKEKL